MKTNTSIESSAATLHQKFILRKHKKGKKLNKKQRSAQCLVHCKN